ncbi:hypothetical protein PG984_011074 [Apiospora sp. TS-2023a]
MKESEQTFFSMFVFVVENKPEVVILDNVKSAPFESGSPSTVYPDLIWVAGYMRKQKMQGVKRWADIILPEGKMATVKEWLKNIPAFDHEPKFKTTKHIPAGTELTIPYSWCSEELYCLRGFVCKCSECMPLRGAEFGVDSRKTGITVVPKPYQGKSTKAGSVADDSGPWQQVLLVSLADAMERTNKFARREINKMDHAQMRQYGPGGRISGSSAYADAAAQNGELHKSRRRRMSDFAREGAYPVAAYPVP